MTGGSLPKEAAWGVDARSDDIGIMKAGLPWAGLAARDPLPLQPWGYP